ncbi:MAG: hypothetical protein LBL50_05415 [Candidatus Margulisbacteria bacterium]|jgi:hypothetical protein|nr:hypothetical protein [Candidatus Margulisiibacteriota bacterium]
MRKLYFLLLLTWVWAAPSITPVNPAEFMSDIVVKEGMRQQPTDNAGRQNAFRQMLLEEVFLRDMFNNENSIYKPEKDDEDSLVFSGLSSIYGDYTRKELAAYLVEQGFLQEDLEKQ